MGIDNLYKETEIQTASPVKLVVLLYEGAIRFLREAVNNIDDIKKYDIVNKNIIRAQDIIAELLVSIDFEAGDIADKLSSLYVYMNKRLIEGNINKDKSTIEEVIGLLTKLKEAWEEISTLPQDEKLIKRQEASSVDIVG